MIADSRNIEEVLRDLFGHASFRPGQREIVDSVLSGRNTLAVLPTGGGKSLTYQLPSTLLPGVTLVLSPLIALMKDQTRSVPPSLADETTVINSSLDPSEVWRRLRSVAAGRSRLVYAAPERLRQPAFLHALRRAPVSLLVIDEAHCISQWGHDFRPDYRAVGRAIEFLNPACVLAVTATASRTVQDDIERQIGRRLTRIIRPTFRKNLGLSCHGVSSEDDKLRALLSLCRAEEGSILVYARSRRKCEELAAELEANGIAAGYYHARLGRDERAQAQDRFMDGSVRVMAATIAFGMGVDKPDVRTLVHYNPSASLENYYQEAGRAGRDGRPSRCILLHTKSDIASALRYLREQTLAMVDLKHVYEGIRRHVGRVGSLGADDLTAILGHDADRLRPALPVLEEVGLLRRHIDVPDTVTVSFRREVGVEADTALRRLSEAADVPVSALSLASQIGIGPMDLELMLFALQDEGLVTFRAAGRSQLFEILPSPPGAKARMEVLLHEREALAKARTNSMLRYMDGGCRHAAIARYFGDTWFEPNCGACDVCVPEAAPSIVSAAVSRSERPREKAAPAAKKRAAPEDDEDLSRSQRDLLARLKAWRTEEARSRGVPAYVVFNDRTLRAIAVEKPSSEREMLAIPGIGAKKAAEWGEAVLRIVRGIGPTAAG